MFANPPFNDGSKGESGWGAERITDKDPRLTFGGKKMPLSPRNANTMWMLHFLSHLKEGGTAGFVMATASCPTARKLASKFERRWLTATTWTASSSSRGSSSPTRRFPVRSGSCPRTVTVGNGFRKRAGEVLFLDGSKLGSLIPALGSRSSLMSRNSNESLELTGDSSAKRSRSRSRAFAVSQLLTKFAHASTR